MESMCICVLCHLYIVEVLYMILQTVYGTNILPHTMVKELQGWTLAFFPKNELKNVGCTVSLKIRKKLFVSFCRLKYYPCSFALITSLQQCIDSVRTKWIPVAHCLHFKTNTIQHRFMIRNSSSRVSSQGIFFYSVQAQTWTIP